MTQSDQERAELLVMQIMSLGAKALSTTHCMSAAVRLAPTTTLKRALLEYAREELERFHGASMLYQRNIDGGDLLSDISDRLAEIPAPSSWLEVVVMQCLFDRAGRLILSELAQSKDAGLAELAKAHLDGGRIHAAMAAESGNALRNTLVGDPELVPEAQKHLAKWLGLSLRSFGRPGSKRGQRAVELGLKPRNSEQIVLDYLAEVKPIVASCKLDFPTAQQLGVELPSAA